MPYGHNAFGWKSAWYRHTFWRGDLVREVWACIKNFTEKNLSMCYFSLLLQALEKPFHLGNLGNSSPCKYPDPYPGFKVWGGEIHP